QKSRHPRLFAKITNDAASVDLHFLSKSIFIKVNRRSVIRYFCEETGMPAFLVDPEVPMDLKAIQQHFNSQLFGQQIAVDQVVNLLASVKTALTRTGKPIASFLFVGPTGVGKTEMARLLAGFTFGDRDKMVRFDMSEYSSPYAVLRLTGSDYFSDGLLTAAVRREPFCVLLFDEIEKADPSFYDLLLQMLGEGRLTDSKGQLVNFCSTIIIMTSNIGATNLMNNNIGWRRERDGTEVAMHFKTAVEKHFRPELINRIDQLIPFEPLGRDSIRLVIEREVKGLRQREGIRFRNMDLFIDDAVLDYLAEAGFNTKYGARELQRTIRELLIIPLATALNVQDYDDQVVVRFSMKQDQIALSVEADPLGLELLLEELEKVNLADQASELRRALFALQEGSPYLSMISDFDMMERERKVKGEKFFKQKDKAERYTQSLTLMDAFDKLRTRIEKLELELALQCMELENFQPQYAKKIERWMHDVQQEKINLLSYLRPEENRCYLHIYGSEPGWL
ncbi:MAG: AAA family ATPase, partial [Bacteroidota bacterium]